MRSNILITTLAVILAMLPVTSAAQVTHTVNQVGTSFSPANLTIQVGDTVRWVWSIGFHTVTNGTGAADPSVGTLFDTPLNSTVPQFEFVFTEAGTVPYFCRPHEIVDMKGTVVVEEVGTMPPRQRFRRSNCTGSVRIRSTHERRSPSRSARRRMYPSPSTMPRVDSCAASRATS